MKPAPSKCCNHDCKQGRDCPMRMPAQMGLSQAERDMVDAARRSRNCALGIIATLVTGYFVLLLIGGQA